MVKCAKFNLCRINFGRDLSYTIGIYSFITTNTYINANHHIVATIGVDNLIIVDTADATFIATQDKEQEVKSEMV